MTKPLVFVSGRPRSGNTLIKRLVDDAGGIGYVVHGNAPLRIFRGVMKQEPHEGVFMVIPVRSSSCSLRSSMAFHDPSALRIWKEMEVDHLCSVMRALQTGATVRFVSYEGIIQDPEAERTWLLGFLGLDRTTPWPEPIVDGNAKWLEK